MFGYHRVVWMLLIAINEELVYKSYKHNHANSIEMN